MATAVERSSEPRTPPNSHVNLALASLLGAVYVLAALAVVFFAVPALWRQYITPWVTDRVLNGALWGVTQAAVLSALVWFGRALAGSNPPKGFRGGLFLMISAAITIFFLVRAVGLNIEGSTGQIAMAVVGLVLAFFTFRFFTSPRGGRWMIGVEESGFLHTTQYKRALGQKVRRITLLGILLVGGSGVYSLYFQGILPQDWKLAMPWTAESVTVLAGAQNAIPALLFVLAAWAAYRAVNMPMFAEFLIATEAEMNKVSWSTRRRLMQDTVVVLVTTVLLTLFLLAVDLFWGWLLSRETVGVLPGKATGADKGGKAAQEARW